MKGLVVMVEAMFAGGGIDRHSADGIAQGGFRAMRVVIMMRMVGVLAHRDDVP